MEDTTKTQEEADAEVQEDMNYELLEEKYFD